METTSEELLYFSLIFIPSQILDLVRCFARHTRFQAN